MTLYVPRTQKAWFANGLLWVVGLVVVVVLIAGIFGVVRWLTAPAAGKLQARQQINSGSFRIAAYDHFFNACASIQGLEGQLDAQAVSLATAVGADKSRVEANIAGLSGARAQAIASYNADARKGYTIGQFRASSLPFQLPSGTYSKGVHTSCGA